MTIPQQQTSDQILLKLGEIGEKLATITEQLKAVPDHETRLRIVEAQLPLNLEERLTTLETHKAKIIGAAIAVSVVISAGGTWIGLIITHH